MLPCLNFRLKNATSVISAAHDDVICIHYQFDTCSTESLLGKFSNYFITFFAAHLLLRSLTFVRQVLYSRHKNNCLKIWPAHFMITKRGFILRGSCFVRGIITSSLFLWSTYLIAKKQWCRLAMRRIL